MPKSPHPDAHRTLTVRHGASVGKRDSREDSILPTHQPSYSENLSSMYICIMNSDNYELYDDSVSNYLLS